MKNVSGFLHTIRKENRPYLDAIRDDINARRDPNYFWPSGTQVFCGRQGSGKTISAVSAVHKLKERYPKSILVTNLELTYFEAVTFNTKDDLRGRLLEFDAEKQYIRFDDVKQLAIALTEVNNKYLGVIYLIDEIHTYFNSLESKDMPMYVFTEISQQRKQRKVIIGTSQLFMRMAKPLREQCDNLIMCTTIAGVLTVQRAYDGMTLIQNYDGSLEGKMKRLGWFIHSRYIRSSFDTYQKVLSSSIQFEEMQNVVKNPRNLSLNPFKK